MDVSSGVSSMGYNNNNNNNLFVLQTLSTDDREKKYEKEGETNSHTQKKYIKEKKNGYSHSVHRCSRKCSISEIVKCSISRDELSISITSNIAAAMVN